ncbi:MAG: PIN domain-containing protein [Deltaproteobacteria bacterium]
MGRAFTALRIVLSPQRAATAALCRGLRPLDTLIAAQAVCRGLTLVTNNEREFRRVSGLRRDNWAS